MAIPTNLANLVQSQTLATLLQALSPATGLAAGATVEARLTGINPDGTATAQIGGTTVSLVLAGPEAKQAAASPGATLVLTLLPGEEPAAPLRATLVELRPARASVTAPATPAGLPAALPQATIPSSPTVSPQNHAATVTSSPAAPDQAPTASLTPGGAIPDRQASATPGAQRVHQPAATASAASELRPVSASAPQAVTTPPSPRSAAGPLLGPALARQDGLAPLYANLRAVAQGAVALTVQRPLLQLADQVLARALPVDTRPMTAEVLKDAVQRSGLFLEARQSADPTAVTPRTDLKAGLVALRDALEPIVKALDGRAAARLQPAPADAPGPAPRPSPPHRDGPLALQPIAEPSLHVAEPPLAVAQTLLDQTEAALDRITLSQYASLPLEPRQAEAGQPQRWLTEIPLAFQTGTAILPLQIEKKPPRRDAAGVVGPLWRMRFALDVEPIGPLQGVVTLQGRSVGVSLWAEREETSRLLRSAAPDLEAALHDAAFEHGGIDIHTGQPRVMQPTAGQFLDRMS